MDTSATLSDHAGDFEPSNRERLITASDRLRNALLRAFGPGWRSKTTEEIGVEPTIVEWLESAEFDRLIAFLKLVDRAKFADDAPDSIGDWEKWSDDLVSRLANRPGPK